MMRNLGIAIMGIVLCAAPAAAVHACPGNCPMSKMSGTHEAAAADQMVCPVSGEPVGKDTNITYTYKGTAYRFCCQGCIEAFKKDPEKYINNMDEREKGKAQ
jgi:YHS domain-containing protein